ncbi:bromodomain adjacent to zinc finger domain protein 1A-like [Haliotis asinina]|uniref:bromodomain adjacent to zinc finger domain protein 1A-like n=1 Tax=Haliotis asinina TaxID=109174 RepID=UPI003531E404
MGCKQTKVTSLKQTSAEEALTGKINCPHELYYARSQVTRPTPRLSGAEILQQLRDEGLVPDRQSSGGVAFSVPAVEGVVPRGKPPRRLEQIPVRCFYTAERRRQKADLFRFDRLVEQVQRKQLDREIKHKAVKDEKKRRLFLKKMRAEHQLQMREEKLKKLEEEREAKRKKPVTN